MEISQIPQPEKKKIMITDILEEAWEFYLNNFKSFISHQFLWLIPMLLTLAFMIWIPNKIALREDYQADKYSESVYPYIFLIAFITLTSFFLALIKGILLRYAGEENNKQKLMKQSVKKYCRTYLVVLFYSSLVFFGYELITSPYWLWGIITGHWVNIIIYIVLLMILYYLAIRYFLSLTSAIASPLDRGAFKTSAYMMKNNYFLGFLIILVIISVVYFLFSIGSRVDILFGSFLAVFFGSVFMISINVICYKKLEALKELPPDAPGLRKTNPVIGLLLAGVISLISLSIVSPDIRQRIFYKNDFLVGIVSPKMIFNNGIQIKRPAGWLAIKQPQWDANDHHDFYFLNNPANKMINWINLEFKPITNGSFRKSKLNPEELKQLKIVLGVTSSDYKYNCAYKITETIQELNNPQEYPKGILFYSKIEERKSYIWDRNYAYFYRVIDNKYVLIGYYAYVIHNSFDEGNEYGDTTPEKRDALPKEREEANAFLRTSIVGR